MIQQEFFKDASLIIVIMENHSLNQYKNQVERISKSALACFSCFSNFKDSSFIFMNGCRGKGFRCFASIAF